MYVKFFDYLKANPDIIMMLRKYPACIKIEDARSLKEEEKAYIYYLAYGVFLMLMLSCKANNQQILDDLISNLGHPPSPDQNSPARYLWPIRSDELNEFKAIFEVCSKARTKASQLQALFENLNTNDENVRLIQWIKSIIINYLEAGNVEDNGNTIQDLIESREDILDVTGWISQALQCNLVIYKLISENVVDITQFEPDKGSRFSFKLALYYESDNSVVLLIPQKICQRKYFNKLIEEKGKHMSDKILYLLDKQTTVAIINQDYQKKRKELTKGKRKLSEKNEELAKKNAETEEMKEKIENLENEVKEKKILFKKVAEDTERAAYYKMGGMLFKKIEKNLDPDKKKNLQNDLELAQDDMEKAKSLMENLINIVPNSVQASGSSNNEVQKKIPLKEFVPEFKKELQNKPRCEFICRFEIVKGKCTKCGDPKELISLPRTCFDVDVDSHPHKKFNLCKDCFKEFINEWPPMCNKVETKFGQKVEYSKFELITCPICQGNMSSEERKMIDSGMNFEILADYKEEIKEEVKAVKIENVEPLPEKVHEAEQAPPAPAEEKKVKLIQWANDICITCNVKKEVVDKFSQCTNTQHALMCAKCWSDYLQNNSNLKIVRK